jgi:hypothetical protein
MKTTVTVTADVKITDEIRENAKAQYGNISDKEIANNILYILVGNGLLNQNNKITYWDGVARLENNINEYKVE